MSASSSEVMRNDLLEGPPEALWSSRQAAAYLSVHRDQLYRMVEAGIVPARRIGGRWRFDPQELYNVGRSPSRPAPVAPARRPGRGTSSRSRERVANRDGVRLSSSVAANAHGDGGGTLPRMSKQRSAKPQRYMETVTVEGEEVRRQRTRDGQLGWRLRVYDPRSGRQPETTFWGSERDAQRELDRLQQQNSASSVPQAVHAKAWSLLDWVEVWLEQVYRWKIPPSRNGQFAGVRRPHATWAKARAVCNSYLLPQLGKRTKLRSVEPVDLLDAISSLTVNGGKPASDSTKATVAGVARALFRDACRHGVIESSPAAHLPTSWGDEGTSREAYIPSMLEVETLAAAMDRVWPLPTWARDLSGPNGEGRGDVIRVIAYTGTRWEEIAAAPASAVDRNARLLEIADTASESGGKRDHRRRRGKSQAALRYLALVDQVMPVIDRLDAIRQRGLEREAAREERRQKRGVRRQPNRPLDQRWVLLLSGEQGGWQSYSHFRKMLQKAQDLTGLHHLDAHTLRHFAASLLYAAGVDLEHIREQMGQSSVATTERVYRHMFKVDRSAVAEQVSAAIRRLQAAEVSSEALEAGE